MVTLKITTGKIFIASLLLIVSSFTEAETVRIAGEEWSPFSSKSLPNQGLMNHIISDAFAVHGVEVEFGYFPTKRSLELVKQGEWDASGGWSPIEDRANDYYFTNPIFEETIVLFHRKDLEFDWNQIEDLKKWRIGATGSLYYGEAFKIAEASGDYTISRVPEDLINMRKLLHGRIDLFPFTLEAGIQSLQDSFTKEQREQITYHKKPILKGPLVLLVSKKIDNAEEIVEWFNSGIEIIRESGNYDSYFENLNNGRYKIE